MQRVKSSLLQSLGLFAAATLLSINSAWAQVDTLASIKQKGKIVVGVKADYKPFGYVDPSGKIVGFEIDMANGAVGPPQPNQRKLESEQIGLLKSKLHDHEQ